MEKDLGRLGVLSSRLRMRSRLSWGFAIAGLAVAITVAINPWVQARLEFERAKAGFEETWCSTYGTNPSDIGADQWLSYVEANRDFLEANFHALGIEGVEAFQAYTYSGDEVESLLMLEYAIARYGGGFIEYHWFSEWFSAHFRFFGFPGGVAPKCG